MALHCELGQFTIIQMTALAGLHCIDTELV